MINKVILAVSSNINILLAFCDNMCHVPFFVGGFVACNVG